MNTILVVDDEVSYRLILRKKLESEGYKVIEATDGNNALDIMRIHKESVGLILLDLNMPGMDGQTFYYELKNKLQLDIPIIILTNQSTAVYPTELADFVIKTDISLEELMKKISTYF